MNHIKTKAILCLLIGAPLYANMCTNSVVTYFNNRSQSVNLPRIMSGWTDYVHQYDVDTFNATLAITPGYSQSFKSDHIARCLFGSSLKNCTSCPQIRITGSKVEERDACDWLADYFGLPTDFENTITFEPKISNFFIDFDLHLGLDNWVEGLWFRAWAPFVHTRWDLNYNESCHKATNSYPATYFADAGVANSNLLTQARDFFQDGKTPTIINNFNTPSIPVTFESLKSCRWGECNCGSSLTENGIAEIRFALGWNFAQNETYHLGAGIVAAGPTGTRPGGCNLFEPIVGNGHHWEVGGTLTSHVLIWQDQEEEKQLGGYLDANITHLFATKQKRCFDLCDRPLSRYMLAEKLGKPVSTNLWGNDQANNQDGSTQPSAEFKNAYAPVANLTCAEVDVSVGVQADLVAMLNYSSNGFSLDLGYNFWIRSCEKIEFDCKCPPRLGTEANTWALKGDSYVYGYYSPTGAGDPLAPVALSATQSKCATIHAGRNGTDTQNAGIDNPKFARAVESNLAGKDILNIPLTAAESQTRTSIEPLYINQSDINVQGARSRGQSHSVFTHFSYSWTNDNNWRPYLGIGAQAEFANNSRNEDNDCCTTSCSSPCDTSSTTSNSKCKPNCNSCCDSCNRCALSQWSIWAKGGVSFD